MVNQRFGEVEELYRLSDIIRYPIMVTLMVTSPLLDVPSLTPFVLRPTDPRMTRQHARHRTPTTGTP